MDLILDRGEGALAAAGVERLARTIQLSDAGIEPGAGVGNARQALDRHGLLKYFRFVTDGYEVGLSKSDPRFFQAVSDRIGVKVEDTWVFEDALYAVRGAKEAGARVCAIEDFTAAAHEEIRSIADVYIRDYGELMGPMND